MLTSVIKINHVKKQNIVRPQLSLCHPVTSSILPTQSSHCPNFHDNHLFALLYTLYWFSRAVILNFHKLWGLKQDKFIFSQIWRPEV